MNKNWKKKVFLFLLSQTISLFGSTLVQYAITWYITLRTQSGAMMTISIICGFLPTFFLSPFAGVWADRYNRKTLIILSDSMIAIATLLLAVLFFIGYDAIWLLFAISVVRALGAGIQLPAVGAFLPQFVPEERLVRVNAINGSMQSMVTLLSPLLSGALLAMATIEAIFLIDVITAAIAVLIMLLFLRVPIHAKAACKQSISYFGDMREGFAYIKDHDFVRIFCFFNIIFCVLIAPAAFLTPLQVTRSFGSDVWRLTAVEVIFSIGMVIGGIIMASWGGFKNRVCTMALANLIIGASTLALGIVSAFGIYLIFMGLIGLAMPMFNTPFMVLLQQKVAEDFLGRVFGVFGMISSVMLPLGMLIFGPVADFVKIEWLLVATGLLLLIHGLFILGNKVLIKEGKPLSKAVT